MGGQEGLHLIRCIICSFQTVQPRPCFCLGSLLPLYEVVRSDLIWSGHFLRRSVNEATSEGHVRNTSNDRLQRTMFLCDTPRHGGWSQRIHEGSFQTARVWIGALWGQYVILQRNQTQFEDLLASCQQQSLSQLACGEATFMSTAVCPRREAGIYFFIPSSSAAEIMVQYTCSAKETRTLVVVLPFKAGFCHSCIESRLRSLSQQRKVSLIPNTRRRQRSLGPSANVHARAVS